MSRTKLKQQENKLTLATISKNQALQILCKKDEANQKHQLSDYMAT